MVVFKKNKKYSSELQNTNEKSLSIKEKPKKKKKIGFGHKKKQHKKITSKKQNKDSATLEEKVNSPVINQKKSKENISRYNDKSETDFLHDMLSEEEIIEDQSDKIQEKEGWSKSKRKAVLKKNMNGKPVFLEDTGERIGTVYDTIYDKDGNHIGYKIKDNQSESILSFSLDQFGEDKGGLIFVPSWYTKGIKTIEKLEFKDKISPELTWLLKDHTITEEELYNIFVKHDDIVANYIKESLALRELLNSRLKILERERLTLKEDLMNLTEKRLIKDIDRRKFSEVVMEHRKKVNVLDLNIKKCKELLERLEDTSFGILSRNIHLKGEKKDLHDEKNHDFIDSKNSLSNNEYIKPDFKKYYDLQTGYNELHEEYNTLKKALEEKIEDPFEDKYKDLKQNYEELQEEYNELKLSAENKIKDPYKNRYMDIKKGYDELQEKYITLKGVLEKKIEDPFEDKYFNLKGNYEELEHEYEDLKIAVEKLLQKNDVKK